MMITGDHPLTAQSIATKLGIDAAGGVVTGQELDQYSDEQLEIAVRERSIYARVSPEHKLRLVEALRKQGQIVAMTGDGVNDAPALKQADIGVAMGITGTDVSKEASDMVLLDDNFATIVSAVKEGRTIYDNIRKFVRFSVAGNIGKVLVMLLLGAGSWLVTRRLSSGPRISRWQNLLEVVVQGMRDQIREVSRQEPGDYLPFVGTLFLFIGVSNLLAVVPGFRPPTGSLSTTTALAISARAPLMAVSATPRLRWPLPTKRQVIRQSGSRSSAAS